MPLYHFKAFSVPCFCTDNVRVCVASTFDLIQNVLPFVSSFDQLACLGESRSLSELTLDGNPVALETWYKQAVLRCVLHLRQLDMKRITVSFTLFNCVCVCLRGEKLATSQMLLIIAVAVLYFYTFRTANHITTVGEHHMTVFIKLYCHDKQQR